MPGQVSDWPASSHMFTPGPIRVARGWAAVIGNTAPTPRTTGLRGREGPQSAEQRKGGQVESVDLLSSYYVPITVLNTFLKFFPKITFGFHLFFCIDFLFFILLIYFSF